jgi:hypothetical protein
MNSWGNENGIVTAEDVAAVREATKDTRPKGAAH